MSTQSSLLALTVALCRIDTTTGNHINIARAEQKVVEYIKKSEIQFYSTKHVWNGTPNILITSQKTKTPNICLVGHLDVVPAESSKAFQPRIQGSRLYARGALDMKGGVAVMAHTFVEVLKKNPRANIALMLTGDEEAGGFQGAAQFVNTLHIKPRFAVTVEGMVKTHIINRQKGICMLTLSSTSVSGHSAYPWKNKNPLREISRAIDMLYAHFGKSTDAWKTSISVNSITTSNIALNKTPADATASLDIRFTDAHAHSPKELRDRVAQIVGRRIQVTLRMGGGVLATNPKDPYVQALQRATRTAYGKKLALGFSNGASDGRFFAEKHIPCIEFGPTGSNSHAENEYLYIPSLMTVYQSLNELCLQEQK